MFFVAVGNAVKLSGGMSERFMVAVLKTAVREHRGFESLSLRQGMSRSHRSAWRGRIVA